MGLFGKNKTEKTPTLPVVKDSKINTVVSVPLAVTSVIIKPRVTEKAALLSEKNVYTFEVRKGATKYEIRDAIKALYNVTPTRIHVTQKAPRHFMSRARGRGAMEHGLRKAYVYLKKDDRIELV